MLACRRGSMNDAHCHFFSAAFFEALGSQARVPGSAPAEDVPRQLGWDPPGSPETLAARWVEELDRHRVSRAALIASVPGDADSVARAVAERPDRFVGFFMMNPRAADAEAMLDAVLARPGMRSACLFPAMHGYRADGPEVEVVARRLAAEPGRALFVHCGLLSVGVRTRLGLPNRFDPRASNPLDLFPVADRHPDLPIILPHFGGGFLHEALLLASSCPNVHFDTSSSNGWIRTYPGLTLTEVFRRALDVLGPDRLLFGTDSSFFPRGWQAEIARTQTGILRRVLKGDADRQAVLSGTFDRLFPR